MRTLSRLDVDSDDKLGQVIADLVTRLPERVARRRQLGQHVLRYPGSHRGAVIALDRCVVLAAVLAHDGYRNELEAFAIIGVFGINEVPHRSSPLPVAGGNQLVLAAHSSALSCMSSRNGLFLHW